MAAAGVAVAVLAVVFVARRSAASSSFKVDPASIAALRQMTSLCSLELHDDMMLRDSINGKWIVARERIKGRVSFNLENMRVEHAGDTLVLWLPEETIEVREDASPGGYEVLDAWDSRRKVLPRTLTSAEENELKRRWSGEIEERLRSRGYVARARRNAAATLRAVTSTWPAVADSSLTVCVRGDWEK